MSCPLTTSVKECLRIVLKPSFATTLHPEIHGLSDQTFDGTAANRHLLSFERGILRPAVRLMGLEVVVFCLECLWGASPEFFASRCAAIATRRRRAAPIRSIPETTQKT